MLAAIILLGLLPLAAMPLFESQTEAADDGDDSEGSGENLTPEPDGILETMSANSTVAAPEGEFHQLDATGSNRVS